MERCKKMQRVGLDVGMSGSASEIKAQHLLLPHLSPVVAGFSPMAVQKPGVEQRGMGREKLVLVVCRQDSWCRA